MTAHAQHCNSSASVLAGYCLFANHPRDRRRRRRHCHRRHREDTVQPFYFVDDSIDICPLCRHHQSSVGFQMKSMNSTSKEHIKYMPRMHNFEQTDTERKINIFFFVQRLQIFQNRATR